MAKQYVYEFPINQKSSSLDQTNQLRALLDELQATKRELEQVQSNREQNQEWYEEKQSLLTEIQQLQVQVSAWRQAHSRSQRELQGVLLQLRQALNKR